MTIWHTDFFYIRTSRVGGLKFEEKRRTFRARKSKNPKVKKYVIKMIPKVLENLKNPNYTNNSSFTTISVINGKWPRCLNRKSEQYKPQTRDSARTM